MRLRFTPRSDNKSLCVSFIPIAFQEAAGGRDQQCQVPLAVPHREGMQPEGLCRTRGVREGKVGRRWKRGESGGDAEATGHSPGAQCPTGEVPMDKGSS